MNERSPWRVAGLLLAAISCAGCVSYSRVRFTPAVQDTELRGEADDLQAHVVVAWRGILEREGGYELRFRMHVENPGPTTFSLVPAEFELLDAALNSFGIVAAADLPVAVEAGRSATFDIAFPVGAAPPLENFELGALTLHTRFQGGRWSWSTTFQRFEPHPYPDPYWPWPVSFSFGAVWCFD